MIIPEWTSFNIFFHIFCAVAAILIPVSDYFNVFVLQYSKFRPANGINARLGMFIIYFPSVIVAFVFGLPYLKGISVVQTIVLSMPILHYAKRTLETLFLHKYSGPIDLFSSIFISLFYSLIAGGIAYFNGIEFVAPDLLFIFGVILFVLGEAGNFAHHYILAKLRGNTLDYVLPSGGLFSRVTCPHYLFEIIAWIGVLLASRHLFTLIAVLGMSGYLAARSLKTLQWYQAKFANFPQERKALVPFIF